MSEKNSYFPTINDLQSMDSDQLSQIIQQKERENNLRYGRIRKEGLSQKQLEKRTDQKETSLRLTDRGKRMIIIGIMTLLGIISVSIADGINQESLAGKNTNTKIVSAQGTEGGDIEGVFELETLSPKIYERFINDSNLYKKLKENLPIYKEVAFEENIDWKIIAALHYREAELNPNHSIVSGERLGTKNPDRGEIYYSLRESAQKGAEIFKENLKFAYRREYNQDDETIKRGFLAYNRGGAYVKNNLGPNDSPYVMNYFNENFFNMHWPKVDKEIEPLSGKADHNYGAFTVYKILERAELEGRI